MITLSLVRAELRRLTATRLGKVAFIALMTVPFLYGGLYLWGNQNPYANLKNVPAGLVVSDTGATVDGKTVNYGNTIRTSLLKSDSFDWRELTAAQAKQDLSTGGVDFVVTVPASFSADLASASTSTPTPARVELATNDANSYLSSTIAGQAATAIRSTVAGQVGATAAKQFLVGLSSVRSSLSTAADGAGTLANGAKSAATGAASLASGTATLATGAQSAASGAASVASGAASVKNGAASLAGGLDTLHSKTTSLPSSTSRLAEGAESVASGAGRVKSGSAALSGGLAQIDAGSASTAAALEQRLAADGLSSAQIQQALAVLAPGAAAIHSASTSAATLSSGAATLASGSAQVSSGAKSLAAAAPTLAAGIASADRGAKSISSGAAELATGAASLETGTATLATGAQSAASGSSTLAAGAAKVQSGASTLATKLTSGVGQIPASSAADRDAQATAIGNPASVATTKVTDAGSYGAGLAPFFLSLATWIGSYALFLILRPLSRRAITALRAPVRISLAGWLTPALLGAAQTIGLFLIATLALGFPVVHPIGMIGVLVLTAATFAAILLALNAAFGSVGQFLGLILMLIQLVTAGGTFPWQTLPAPLAALHHALPMSYSVDALRQVMYGGNLSLAWGDIAVLAAWLLGALALTALTTARMTRQRTLRDLQPSLIGG